MDLPSTCHRYSSQLDRFRCSRTRVNVAHVEQSQPNHGPGFKANVLQTFKVLLFSFGSDYLSEILGSDISRVVRVDTLEQRVKKEHFQDFEDLYLKANAIIQP